MNKHGSYATTIIILFAILFNLLLLCILNTSFTSAQSYPAQSYPKIVPYVNDFAGLLTDDQELELNLIADRIEKNTSYEIAIVTVTGTGGQDRIEYANRLGDENGVGKKGASNGIVVLWSTGDDIGGAIATGRGAESIFNDAKVGRIGRASRPSFDSGDYYGAFIIILNGINGELNASLININSSVNASLDTLALDGGSTTVIIIFIVLVFLGIIIIPIFFDLEVSGGGGSFVSSGGFSGGGGFSRGGFSGGSFGGGSFGGGGGRF